MAIQFPSRSFKKNLTATRLKVFILAPLLLATLGLGFLSKSLLLEDITSVYSHYHMSKSPPTTTEEAAAAPNKETHPQDAIALKVTTGSTDRPLVLYVYHETDNARINLQFFLTRGLHARADFIFIFNGETDATELVPAHLANVRVVKRPNSCYDLGALGQVLSEDSLWLRYKRFITMNASIRGPFMPTWSDDCWTDAFLSRLTDEVKLVGLSYSCIPAPHVQSMLLATDHIGMRILLDPAFAYTVPLDTAPYGGPELPTGYSHCCENYTQAVHAEIGMARLIRSQGYLVDVLLTSVATTNADLYCNEDRAGPVEDPFKPGSYFGADVHPYETIFYKANRGLDDTLLGLFTDWHLQMNESSWDKCSRRRGISA